MAAGRVNKGRGRPFLAHSVTLGTEDGFLPSQLSRARRG